MVVFEKSCHREEIAPVMCLFAHTTDEGKWSSARIWDIECDICQVLSEPPESDTRSIWVVLSHEEHVDDDTWDDHLHEAATEYRHELTERHEEYMSRLMKYQIGVVDECIHHSSIDTECIELQGVDEKSYPEYHARDRGSSMESDREEEWVHRQRDWWDYCIGFYLLRKKSSRIGAMVTIFFEFMKYKIDLKIEY